MKYERIIRSMCNDIYTILPEKLEEIVAIIEARIQGVKVDASAFEAEVARRKPIRSGRLGIIPVMGAISHHASAMSSSLGASAEGIGKEFDAMMDSPEVGGVLFNIDSPGGSAAGTPELADKIFARRGQKPIVAVANSLAASGAYWIGSAADEFVSTPSGQLGSIGVVATHVDRSQAMEAAGMKVTYLTTSKYKAEGNDSEPLQDETASYHRERIQNMHNMFIKALARNRDTTERRVEQGFGQGRVMHAKAAKEAGMIDRIATFEQIVSEMTGKVQPQRRRTTSARLRMAIS